MKDLFGIEINIGDLVVPTKDSSFAGYFTEPYVVTRFGSDDKVQLNGIEYGKADKLVVFTKQYEANNEDGFNAMKHLRDKYSKFFNEVPVQKKDSPSRFLIMKLAEYCPTDPIVTYTVIEVKGNNRKEHYKSINEVLDIFKPALGDYFKRESLNKKGKFYYSEVNDSISKKKLHELGLQNYINQEIPESLILSVAKLLENQG